jgi:hypothetical protein
MLPKLRGLNAHTSNPASALRSSAGIGLLWSLLLNLLLLAAAAAPARAQTFNYAEALQKSMFFYECQRSGPLPTNTRVTWRANSALNDGSDVGHNLTGGWYDAGDHVKFGFPMAFSATALAWGAIDFQAGYSASGQLQYVKNNLRFVNDYFIKCHTAPNELWGQVGNGGLDHAWWGSAEVLPMSRPAYKIDATHPGSDLAAETAAAMAAASIVFATDDPTYSATLKNHAIQLYSFAETYRGSYSSSITDAAGYYNSYSGYNDELVWGAIWLYRATNDASYLAKAESYYANLSTEPQSTVKSYKWGIAWDDKSYGCYVLLAKLTGKQQYKDDAERHLDYWTDGYNGQRITYTPGGLAWLDQWGSLRYAANTAFLALYYSPIATTAAKSTKYYNFAKRQIDYALGQNPGNHSFVCGFGVNPPKSPHHRTAHGAWANNLSGPPTETRHILYGALVGGPGSNDAYTDDRSNYTNNEVATDYNALFSGALAKLTTDFGGAALANFPVAETPSGEFLVEARQNSVGNNFMEVAVWVSNHTAWPARIPTQFKFRLFVDISEGLAAGYTLSNYTVTTNNGTTVSVTPLQAWDSANNIYFTEVTYKPGVVIWPGGQSESTEEAQVRISLPSTAPASAWSTANDYSYQGLDGTLRATTNIPLYVDGALVYGAPPSTSGTNLTVSPTSLSFASAAGTSSVSVTSNVSWTASANQSWITVSPVSGSNNGSLAVSVTANTGTTARSGTVTVAGGGISRTVTVTQAAPAANSLSVSPTSMSFTAASGSSPATVTSNVAWTASANQTWITVTPASGSGNGTLTVTVASNTGTASRSGTVTLTGGGLTSTISVTQAAPAANSLSVSPTTMSFTSASGSSTATVTSNVAWTASASQTWITVSPTSGTGNGTLTVTVAGNTGTASRSGTVTLSGGGLTATISVSQAAPSTSTLTISPTSLSFAAGAGNSTISVSSNVSWTASASQTWITVAPASGTNNGTVTVSVTANTGTASRTGTVTIAGGGITRTASITQAAPNVTTPCSNPTTIALPFSKDGAGEFCWVTSGTIGFINSWNMRLLEINGVAYTNVWAAGTSLPPRINGNYYIHYIGDYPWSHFEASVQ